MTVTEKSKAMKYVPLSGTEKIGVAPVLRRLNVPGT